MKNKNVILTITKNSSHIWKYFINSYKQFCKEYDLVVIDNNSRKGDQEYLNTYVDDGTIYMYIQLKANYLFTHSVNRAIELINSAIKLDEGKRYDQIILANPDIEFLENWDITKPIDLVYVDDWHSYEHVKRELEILDTIVSPNTIIILHDLIFQSYFQVLAYI